MLSTIEMRWFFAECPLDREIHSSPHTEQQERSDWYAMPCQPHCGIKLREGKLETKLFIADHGLRAFRTAAGKLEAWKKWSLEYVSQAAPTREELIRVGWIEVNKVRSLQRFEIDAQQLHPTSTRPVSGCEFELTELNVLGHTAWTVGFEAVGPASHIEGNLERAVSQLLGRGGLLADFTADRSYGYAQWLTQFNACLDFKSNT